ncbi:aminotransferase class V-fold PLP-dependent enzyme [Ornithinibacillus sp. L9]|uniref:Aminotransferase class V-fold PLP-dependent enzyme n=1 Tax=Ornithinibacillus caprae TaxID=2678566 RepID=A0A6N8FM77_9BACI|nr:alanine--glyoxylate aminotransferase family protein [Ornithinibacillus caprae]MUK88849.1 aminotransferase class V-fold PLP-dependent enzyme [Ornithinibacillus caprae]
MLSDQQFLRIPGPTPIPPSVQRAMSQPMVGHRDQETKHLLQTIKPKLKPIFDTKNDIAIIAGSGTAGLETAVINSVQPNDEVLVIVTGAFGDRFAQICETYHLRTHRINVTWGEAVPLDLVESYLNNHPAIKAVFATFCETSTGILNPVEKLANIIRRTSEALFIVDGVSSVGAVPTKMDEWDVDIVVTGSQKAFMLPPGLTFIAISDRAWQAINANQQPRFYLDLRKYRDNSLLDSTPFTPSLSLLYGLKQVLELFENEGLKNVFARHQLMMHMTRAAFRNLNIPLLTNDTNASPTVTAIQPVDFQADSLRKIVKEHFHTVLAGGQANLKGKIFRIGHMGYCSPADVLQTISSIEIGLQMIGKKITLGAGTQAAQEVYLGGFRK